MDSESALFRIASQEIHRRQALDLNTDVPKFFVQGAQGTSEYLIKNLTGVAKNLVSLVIDFSIVLMIFFYLLRDGEDYYKSLRGADAAA